MQILKYLKLMLPPDKLKNAWLFFLFLSDCISVQFFLLTKMVTLVNQNGYISVRFFLLTIDEILTM